MCSITSDPGKLRSAHTLTHTYAAHHKYAFVPLLVGVGPGNILNVIAGVSISLLLAARGRGAQQEAPHRQFMTDATLSS